MAHLSCGIAPQDADLIRGKLTKHRLTSGDDTRDTAGVHDRAADYKSHHTNTPDG